MTTFTEMLQANWAEGKYLCVGLDPDINKIPGNKSHRRIANAIYSHMAKVVLQTASVAAAFKPNTAFYESLGSKGFDALEGLVGFIKKMAPGVPVILDAKRGDIGNTNEHYAKMAFDIMGADAITIHPYLGWEANKPFLDRPDKGIFVLGRTSNPGAGQFQDVEITVTQEMFNALYQGIPLSQCGDGLSIPKTMPLYQWVAWQVANRQSWNYNSNCGLVTGATYPDEIRQVRAIAPDIPLLIPGIGKQGGDLEASVMAARHRFLINSSSGIIFADDPRYEAEMLHYQIQEALAMVAGA